MRSVETVTLSLLVLFGAASSAASEVQLSIRDGRISIVARDATVGQILAEWATVGQTKIVNLERIPRDPVTIELQDVSEEQALDVVLRTASGYVAALRPSSNPNVSRFDRIIVMPPSVVVSSSPRTVLTPAASDTVAAQYQPVIAPPEPPPPVAAPPADDNSYTAGGDVVDETPFQSEAGAVPPADPRIQATYKRRQALETVDPREFKLPAQSQGSLMAPTSAAPPRALVPGTIVQPAPRPPG